MSTITTELGFYDYVSNINRKTLFRYIVIAVFIIALVSFIAPSPIFLAGLSVAIIILTFVNDKRVSESLDLNEELEYKLNSLFPRPEFFHLNVNAINFFHDFKDLGAYNKQAYSDALDATDNMLRLLFDFRTGSLLDCANHIEVAKDFKDSALNHIDSLFHSFPLTRVTEDKHKRGLENFQLILTRIIDEMNEICSLDIKERGINVRTRFPDIYDGPRGFDAKQKDDSFFKY